VTKTYDLARQFGRMIETSADFELAALPESNIVCFRYVPEGASDLDEIQAAVRKRLLEEGTFYLVQARLPTGLYLRTALMNPFTQEIDLKKLLETIRTTRG